MTVSLRNTPLLAGPTTGTGTITTASTYNGTTPVTNDLLVLVVTQSASTSTTVGSAPAGWTLSAINETEASTTHTRVSVYTRTADGTAGDNAPSFVASCSGTSARDGQTVVAYIFYDSGGGTPVLATSGVAQGTSGTVAPVTGATVATGSYAVAAVAEQYTSSQTVTWTLPTSWTSRSTAPSSVYYSYAHYSYSGPPSGSTLTCSMAHSAGTTAYEAAFVAVFSPPPPRTAPPVWQGRRKPPTRRRRALRRRMDPGVRRPAAASQVPPPFAPNGTWIHFDTTSPTFTLTTAAVGDLVLVEVQTDSLTVWCTGITSSNVTWAQVGTEFTYSSGIGAWGSAVVFAGTVTGTGADTATMAFNGTQPTTTGGGQEFTSSTGMWSLDGTQGNLGSGGSATMPSLTPAGAGDLYFIYANDTGTATAGTTAGYTYETGFDASGNGACFNGNCTSAAQAPSFADGGEFFGIAVLLSTAAGGASAAGSGSLAITGTAGAAAVAVASGSLSVAGTAAAAGQAVASGSLAVTGTAAWVIPPVVAGSLSVTGTAAAQAKAVASGSLSVAGGTVAAAGQAAAAGSLSVAGTAAWEVTPPVSGALAITGASVAAAAPAAASGSLAISGLASLGPSAMGSLTISGTAAAAAPATAAGSLAVTGTAAAAAPGAASGALAISGTAAWAIPPTVSGALAISGTAAAKAPASGAGALAVSGTAAWVVPPTVAGALVIAGGAVAAQAPAAAAGSLAIAGTAAGQAPASAAGSLSIAGTANIGPSAMGALAITGATVAWQPPPAAGTLAITGTAAGKAPASGGGLITITGTSAGKAPAGAAGFLTIAGLAVYTPPVVAGTGIIGAYASAGGTADGTGMPGGSAGSSSAAGSAGYALTGSGSAGYTSAGGSA